MNDYLDIGGFIEQAVQEALHETSQPAVPARSNQKTTDFVEKSFRNFRVGNRGTEISLEGRSQDSLGLVGVQEDPSLHSEPLAAPTSSTEKNVVYTGGYGAGLWGGRQHYAQMILKKKLP